MNLYELAHHPEAWNVHTHMNLVDPLDWWLDTMTNRAQFELLVDDLDDNVHSDSHEFRMHLLFVYFATTDEKEWP